MKAMRRISRGKSFAGVLNYAFRVSSPRDEPVQFLGGGMSGSNVKELVREFSAIQSLRPDIEKKVWHQALRLPAGEKMSNEKWVEFADTYMKRMDFSDLHQRAYLLHNDADGQHVHIIASRVSLTSDVNVGHHDSMKSTEIIEKMEHEFGLQITKGVNRDESGKMIYPDEKRASRNEEQMMERTQSLSDKEFIKDIIKEALRKTNVDEAVTLTEFIRILNNNGIEVELSTQKNGISGISFKRGETAVSGTNLGAKYTFGKLSKRFDYESRRDFSAVESCKSKFAERTRVEESSIEARQSTDKIRERKTSKSSARLSAKRVATRLTARDLVSKLKAGAADSFNVKVSVKAKKLKNGKFSDRVKVKTKPPAVVIAQPSASLVPASLGLLQEARASVRTNHDRAAVILAEKREINTAKQAIFEEMRAQYASKHRNDNRAMLAGSGMTEEVKKMMIAILEYWQEILFQMRLNEVNRRAAMQSGKLREAEIRIKALYELIAENKAERDSAATQVAAERVVITEAQRAEKLAQETKRLLERLAKREEDAKPLPGVKDVDMLEQAVRLGLKSGVITAIKFGAPVSVKALEFAAKFKDKEILRRLKGGLQDFEQEAVLKSKKVADEVKKQFEEAIEIKPSGSSKSAHELNKSPRTGQKPGNSSGKKDDDEEAGGAPPPASSSGPKFG